MTEPAFRREPAAGLLRELRTAAAELDPKARGRIEARERELGRRVTTAEKYELYGPDTYLPVSDEVGALLYLLVRARRPARVVEFGASRGISTVHLAAALADAGTGSLVTTEIEPAKAEATRANLARAGLADRVEVLAGDARTTLAGLSGPVDVLFLDGRNDLYLDVLRLVEPALAPGALVLADLSPGDPDLEPYLALVRDPDGAFTSVALAGGGLEASIRVESPPPAPHPYR